MNLKVKVLMVKKKVTQTAIARDLGVTQGTVSSVINGHRQSRRIKQGIASILGVEYRKLWGRAA